MPIRLLTFDLDDTLWEVEPVIARAEATLHDWLAQRAPALTARFTPEQLRSQRLALMQSDPDRAHRISALRIDALTRALLDIGSSEDEATKLAAEAFAVFFEARHEVQLFEAVEEVLEQLGERYRLGVITNGNADVRRLAVGRHFDFIVHSEHLTRAKPHPEPFLEALRQGDCDVSECLHVGDHIDHDIRAAQRLGIATLWVNRHGTRWPGGEPPAATVTHWKELPAAVEAIDSPR
jgi:putative hydrolase of the HAD superfamily